MQEVVLVESIEVRELLGHVFVHKSLTTLRGKQFLKKGECRTRGCCANLFFAALAEVMPGNSDPGVACCHRRVDKPDRVAILVRLRPCNARD